MVLSGVLVITASWFWWLRSPGNNSNNAANVNDDGNVNVNGNNVNNNNGGVRPALPLPKCPKLCSKQSRSALRGKGAKSPLFGNGRKTHADGKVRRGYSTFLFFGRRAGTTAFPVGEI